MSDDLNPEHHHVVERLRAMGEERVDPVVASEHLTAMAALRRRPQKRFGRRAVAGAALAGFLLGGLGLGYADALPGPAQGVAENMLEFVGIEGEWKNRGHCISTQAQAPANATDEAAKAAAKEQCPKGKPEGAGQGAGRQGKVKAHADDPCRGAPPWAGRGGGPTAEEQAAHDHARATTCGPDTAGAAGTEVEEPEAEGSQLQQEQLETTDTSEATTDDTTATTEDTTATTEDTSVTTEDTTATTEDTTVTTEDTTVTTEAGS